MSNVRKRKDRNGRVLPDNVSHRADGRYIYRTQLYGKPHYIYDYDLNNLKDKILEFNINLKSGKVKNIGKLTLDEWYPQYVDLCKRDKVKDTTLQNYIRNYEWYIKGSIIGRMPLKDLKRSMVIMHFKELADKKDLSQTTMKGLASMLYGACQQAVYDDVIHLNPFIDIMKEVKATPKEIRDALTIEETKLMLEFLSIEGTWQNVYLPLIGIFLGTGCRFGELMGLTWNDVDMERKKININHSINYRDRGRGKHEFFITDPKTVNSNRTIVMSEEVYKLFEKQRRYQKQMRIRDDIKIDGYKNFVFTAKTGIPFTHEAVVRSTKLVIKRANEWEVLRAKEENRKPVVIREHTPHYWRHTFATRLVEREVACEIVKDLLGHSSIKTTIDIYTHCQNRNNKQFSNAVGDMLYLV